MAAIGELRTLGRGMRGEDVLGWQRFLMNIRMRPELGASIPAIRVDGIYGIESARATRAFQFRFGLTGDGIVGPRTWAAAAPLGLAAVPPTNGQPAAAGPPGSQTKVPVVPIGPSPPPPPPPPSASGSTRQQSWSRLRAEGWTGSKGMLTGLGDSHAVLQSATGGSGEYVYDEYKVEVTSMPTGLAPEAFLLEMAKDLNGTVKDSDFDTINVFHRRASGDPHVGEIIDIDIMGPDNGSVILAELGVTYFVFQTIDCLETGSHPENGSREFGFERHGTSITFYTRGVSRPSNAVVGFFGARPQALGWTSLMHGISTQIGARGGASRFDSFSSTKDKRPD
ncbi:MAG TPA: peptidoglycan-binding domain-containing protein [Polyangia bacterium]